MRELGIALAAATTAALIPLIVIWLVKQIQKNSAVRDLVLGDPDRRIPAMRDLIVEQTTSIQPGANGGDSLSDLHRKVDAKFDRLNETVETHLHESLANWEQVQARLADLESQREAAHLEAVAMWKAVEAVAEAQPPVITRRPE